MREPTVEIGEPSAEESPDQSAGTALTEGSLVKRLGQLALPFLIPNLLHLVVLVADRVWIGDIGTEAMAGLGIAHAALMICVTLLMGPAIGTLAGVARAVGGGDPEEARRLFGQGMLIGLFVGAFFALLAFFAPAFIMEFMAGGAADPTVLDGARSYLTISLVSLLFNAPLFALTFGVQGAGDGKAAFVIGAIAPVVNLILDPILIFGCGLGLPGAAWATLIAYGCALIGGCLYLMGPKRAFGLDVRQLRPDLTAARFIIRVGLPGTLEQLVRTCALFLLVRVLAEFGATVLSAYTATIVVTMVLVLPGLAFGQATAALMGQNLGANKPQRAWRTAWTSVTIYAGVMIVAGLFIWSFAPILIGLFDGNEAVVEEGAQLLRVMVLSFPAIAVALILSKAFAGASTTLPPMIAAALAHLVFQIPCAWLFSDWYGALGAYIAMAAAFYVHAMLNAVLFWRIFGGYDQPQRT